MTSLNAVGFGGDDAAFRGKQTNAKASQKYERKCKRVIARINDTRAVWIRLSNHGMDI